MNKSWVETLPCTTGRTAILQFRWSWNSVMNTLGKVILLIWTNPRRVAI
jgi:hypothetical protein